MAAIAKSGDTILQVLHTGQTGSKTERGIASFNSTDATGTLKSTLEYITGAKFTPINTVASDEEIGVSGTIVGNRVKRSVDGTYTLARTGASPTSGLSFFYELVGG